MIFYLKNQAVQISGKTYEFQCALFMRAAMCITNRCGPMLLPVLPPLPSMSFPPCALLMSHCHHSWVAIAIVVIAVMTHYFL